MKKTKKQQVKRAARQIKTIALDEIQDDAVTVSARVKEVLKNRKVQMAIAAVALHCARKMVKSRKEPTKLEKLGAAVAPAGAMIAEAKMIQLVEKYLKEKFHK